MHKQVKISKGLDINLKGKPAHKLAEAPRSKMYVVKPTEFYGINPRLSVKKGDHVNAGDPLFYHKYIDRIKFTSPVSGTVEDIVRGEKRKILKIMIRPDATDTFKTFKVDKPENLDRNQLLDLLLESGLFATVKQRPYDVIANPDDSPKAIFISAYDSAPLGVDYNFALKDKMDAFKNGLKAVRKLTDGKVYLVLNGNTASDFDKINEEGVEIVKAFGPHPVGNVSISIEQFEPLAKGDRIWVVNPADVALIGQFLETGQYNPVRNIALAGSKVKEPMYYTIKAGAHLSDFLKDKLDTSEEVRIISGNVLTGADITKDQFLNFYDNEVTVIPLGKKPRFMGWLPFIGKNRKSFYNFGFAPKELDLDASLYGEERAFVMNEEFEAVMPLDIYPVHLLKAALLGDVEKMEQLGILEVAPEDFALLDYISSSKIDTQELIRKGLDIMQVEMES
jgi:Na+-transporting NADH:ubiquinone oxidoreductase subunit A